MTEERKQLRKKLSAHKSQKEELVKLKRKLKNKKLKDYERKEIEKQIDYIEEYSDEVKSILKKFEELCGRDCKKLIEEVYIEQAGVTETAKKYKMSRRKLEAYLEFWVEECYLKNKKPTRKFTPWTYKQ